MKRKTKKVTETKRYKKQLNAFLGSCYKDHFILKGFLTQMAKEMPLPYKDAIKAVKIIVNDAIKNL